MAVLVALARSWRATSSSDSESDEVCVGCYFVEILGRETAWFCWPPFVKEDASRFRQEEGDRDGGGGGGIGEEGGIWGAHYLVMK